MRKRELIAVLKKEWLEIRKTQTSWTGNAATIEKRRQAVHHDLETLLPEIIEKLEAQP
ncbi:MAG: hypothetical protein NVV83_10545 [Afipia sp.]|nr:hypothetical protein [Afipia sp.]